MSGAAEASEVLAKAADLLEPEGAWTRGGNAYKANGHSCGEWDPFPDARSGACPQLCSLWRHTQRSPSPHSVMLRCFALRA